MKNFLRNLLGFPMSHYKKALRKNVQKFYHRAIRKAVNDAQRKLWLAAGLAAEDFVTTLLVSEGKDDGELFKQRILNKTMEKKQIRTIIRTMLKVYLSALLIAVTNYKEEILTKTSMNEQDFLKSWCSVFDYKQEDMHVFDGILLPAYRRNGLNGLRNNFV